MSHKLTIALAGNPNCGKTTLFNEITGSNGFVGNWPGVTVEKKQACLKQNSNIDIIDLPGVYSLAPYSPEERVTRDFILQERPDVVVNVVDSTNIERSLYLTTQLLEAGRPVVVALNMSDIVEQRGEKIDERQLSHILGVPVVKISALKKKGLDELINLITNNTLSIACPLELFSSEIERLLQKIEKALTGKCSDNLLRWYAIKILEQDTKSYSVINLSQEVLQDFEKSIHTFEEEQDDDMASILASSRYEWIAQNLAMVIQKQESKQNFSQKIDRIITSRVWGLPIFVAVMALVYYIAIGSVGTAATDWVNDNLFADGFFTSSQAQASFEEADQQWKDEHYANQINAYIEQAKEQGVDTDGVQEAIDAEKPTEEDTQRIEKFEQDAQTAQVVATNVAVTDENGNYLDTHDEIITKEAEDGSPVLAEGQQLKTIDHVMLDDFKKAVETPEPDPHEYGSFVDSLPVMATYALEELGASEVTISLVVDGVIGGVGSVLGFIPQIIVLFILLCFLEDCGYLSRVAFVMDRVFRRFGLSGKSFIPMIISSGCGVPGVLATKTIENEQDRRMTVMLTTMIPCSAKLPIIALVMGVLVGADNGAWWVAPLFYFMSIAAIILSAIMLKKTKPFRGKPAPFIMELPDYHMPALRSWALHVWERIAAYVKKAGTIIFLAAIGIWFLSNFGFATWDGANGAFCFLQAYEAAPENYMDYSLLAAFGHLFSWIFAPLGFGNWQATASTASALIAKENLVSTFGVLYGLGDATENSVAMWQGFANMFTTSGVLHIGAMCGFVAFNMLCAPCFAAMGAIRKQMDDKRWFWFAILYQCVFGWIVALIINQMYELIVFGTFGIWTVVAAFLLAAIIFQVFRPQPQENK